MALSSMTGFAAATGEQSGLNWQWELKSVNGKTLEMRARLPTGFDALDAVLRPLVMQSLRRGNIQISLTLNGGTATSTLQLNEAALEQVAAAAEILREKLQAPPVQAEALLALPGILKLVEATPVAARYEELQPSLISSLEQALRDLLTARYEEGARLSDVIVEQLNRIEELTCAARDNPARSVVAVRARLNEQVNRLLESGEKLDPDRLHQEAVLLATRADIQEEIDRLLGHVQAARELLSVYEPVGRKFDFLAQEFNREANTLCSKAIDISMSKIGLELKTVIDQLREQVQNIE